MHDEKYSSAQSDGEKRHSVLKELLAARWFGVQYVDMKIAAFLFSALALCGSSYVLAQATQPTCPTEKGAYYRDADSWKAMDPSHSIGFKTTNVAGAAFSYGAAKARIKAQFRDGRSPYQLKDGHITICLVDMIDSGRDITMGRFQEEKDRREISMASYRMWTGVNAQIDPKIIIPTEVEKKSDKVYVVTTKEPVSSGEFILFTIVPDVAAMAKANTPSSLGGYDFGFHIK